MDAEKNDQVSVKQKGNVNKDTEEIDTSATSPTKEQTDNSAKGQKSTINHLDMSDSSPQDLLGQYVLVSYDKPYPGIVTDWWIRGMCELYAQSGKTFRKLFFLLTPCG